MNDPRTRRGFARDVAYALGAFAAAPGLARAAVEPAAAPRIPPTPDPPAGTIRLDSNENPYGPSAGALEAMSRSQKVAARYPDALEDELAWALAKLHGAQKENVLLGCGSGEILRMADMAFLGPDRTIVAAEPTFEAVLSYAWITRAVANKGRLTPA